MQKEQQIQFIQKVFIAPFVVLVGLLALMLTGCTEQSAFPGNYYVDFVNDFHLGSMSMANADKNYFSVEELNEIPADEEKQYHAEADISLNYGKYIKDFALYRLHITPFVQISSSDVHNFTINQKENIKFKVKNLINQNVDGKLRIKITNKLLYSEEYPPEIEYSLLPNQEKTIEIPISTESLGNKDIEVQAKANIELGRMVEKQVEIEVTGVNLRWIRQLVFDKSEIFASQPFLFSYAVQPIVKTTYTSQPTIKLNQTSYTIPRTNADKLKDYLFYAVLIAVLVIAAILIYFMPESKGIIFIIATFAILAVMGFSYYGLSAQQSAIGTEDYITYIKGGDAINNPLISILVPEGCAKENDLFVLNSQDNSQCGINHDALNRPTYYNGKVWLKKDFSGYDVWAGGGVSYCGCTGGWIKVEVSRLDSTKGICYTSNGEIYNVDCNLVSTNKGNYEKAWRQQELVGKIPANVLWLNYPSVDFEVKYRIPYDVCNITSPDDVLGAETFSKPIDIFSTRYPIKKLCTNIPNTLAKGNGYDVSYEVNNILVKGEQFDPAKYGIETFQVFYIFDGSLTGIKPACDWKNQYFDINTNECHFRNAIVSICSQGTFDPKLGLCLVEGTPVCQQGRLVEGVNGTYNCIYNPPVEQQCKEGTLDLTTGKCTNLLDKETNLPTCPDNMFRKISRDGKNVICEAQLTEDTLSSEIKIDKAIESAKKLKFIYLGVFGIVILVISAVLIRRK